MEKTTISALILAGGAILQGVILAIAKGRKKQDLQKNSETGSPKKSDRPTRRT